MVFDERGRLLTGADIPAAVAMLEGLRVDALGLNCGFGPEQMLPLMDQLESCCSIPILVSPNAGLPVVVDSQTVYNVSPADFAAQMAEIVRKGALDGRRMLRHDTGSYPGGSGSLPGAAGLPASPGTSGRWSVPARWRWSSVSTRW